MINIVIRLVKCILKYSLVLMLGLSTVSSAQRGVAYSDRLLESKILNQKTHYSIYLPPDYETSTYEYPVLYLFHGGGDDWRDWLLRGQAATIADRTILSGEAPAMIIVMPDGIDDWYNNKYDGTSNYEDYFFRELIPHIEATYRCRTEKRYRAISGLSMGGRGCLLYALKHPDIFQACYAMSIGMFSDKNARVDRWGRGGSWLGENYFGPLKADGSLPDTWHTNDVYRLARELPDKQKRSVIFAVELGDDEVNRDQMEMVLTMKENQIPVELRVIDGGHNWGLWRISLPKAMKFVGECFLQVRSN
jgi:enterochelin esterase-like enzyme